MRNVDRNYSGNDRKNSAIIHTFCVVWHEIMCLCYNKPIKHKSRVPVSHFMHSPRKIHKPQRYQLMLQQGTWNMLEQILLLCHGGINKETNNFFLSYAFVSHIWCSGNVSNINVFFTDEKLCESRLIQGQFFFFFNHKTPI